MAIAPHQSDESSNLIMGSPFLGELRVPQPLNYRSGPENLVLSLYLPILISSAFVRVISGTAPVSP